MSSIAERAALVPRWGLVVGACVLVQIVLTFAYKGWPTVAPLGPDDMMRLLQVRDWLAGQSWFDVDQARIGGEAGLSLHWSRLVDLPLALVIGAGTLLVGQDAAEAFALRFVPFATLCCAVGLAFSIGRRMAGEATAAIGLALALASTVVLFQFAPGRIDHHGWQIVAGLATLRLLMDGGVRSALFAGPAAAAWLHISVEALPFVAALGAILALDVLLDEERASARLFSFVMATGAASTMLFAFTRWGGRLDCDVVGPGHLAAFGAAALVLAALPFARTLVSRLAVLGVGGAAAGGAMFVVAPACVLHPFAQLGPLTREHWYERVREGMPVWREAPVDAAVLLVGAMLVALGLSLLWKRAIARREQRTALLFACAATLVGLLVLRAGGLAQLASAFALGTAVVHLRARLLGENGPLLRRALAAIVIAYGATALGRSVLLDAFEEKPAQATRVTTEGGKVAKRDRYFVRSARALAGMPALDVLAPINAGPALALHTKLRPLAAGYHRGGEAIEATLRAFLGSERDALAIVRMHGIGGIVLSGTRGEGRVWRTEAPDGFYARLECGVAPDWLRPDPGVGLLNDWGVPMVWRVGAGSRPAVSDAAECARFR